MFRLVPNRFGKENVVPSFEQRTVRSGRSAFAGPVEQADVDAATVVI